MTELDTLKYLVSDKHLEDIREKCRKMGKVGTGLKYAHILGEVRAILKSPMEPPEGSGLVDEE